MDIVDFQFKDVTLYDMEVRFAEGMDEDDIAEMMQEDMEQDIHYLAVIYNPEDEEHVMVMHDQNDKPHEI